MCGLKMRQSLLWMAIAAVLCLGTTAFGQAKKPTQSFSDEEVSKAIKKGVDYLLKTQGPDGSWPAHGAYPVGPTAMATYALLESEVYPANDPRIKKALDWLAKRQAPGRLTLGNKTPKEGGGSLYCFKTYSLGLRANAFHAATKRGLSNYKKNLRKDVVQLILSTKNGSYGYNSYGNGQSSGDNSNS